MQKQLFQAEENGRMEVDNQPLWPNENDVDEQMHTLMNEPFVLRIQDFFNLTLEKIKDDHNKRTKFLSLCRTFDGTSDSNYEDSLKEIFELVCKIEPLDQIFVELLPEKFTQRIFPKIEANIVQRFDQEVKDQTKVEEYDQYIKCVLDFYHDRTTSEQQFKEQMTKVLTGYPNLLEQLPIFFSEIAEPEPQSPKQQPAEVAPPQVSQPQPQKQSKVKNAPKPVQIETTVQPVGPAATIEPPVAPLKTPVPPAQKAQPTPIPASLQKFAKNEVSFLLDKVPEMLKDRSLQGDFMSLFALYLDGVLTQSEFFDLASDIIHDPANSEQFCQLQNYVQQRDNSRRDYLEIGLQKFVHMLSKSYGIFSDEYVAPICSGRYAPGEHSLWVLNDRYSIKTSGTEDYKFKIKNIHEDNLFKNEDEMYAIDHQILQFERVIKKLNQEESEASTWREAPVGDYEPRFLTEQHFSFIRRFYEEVMDQPCLTFKKIDKIIRKKPVELIDNWIQRLKTHLSELKSDKADKIAEWKQLCESNFIKSLDHRSFFFKKEQKELLPAKKQHAELDRISSTPLSKKSSNQLKGGSSPDHEFYCTYTSFKINHIQVYTSEDLLAPSLLNDSPINLCEPEVLTRNPAALPHMRFLLNDKKMLEMAFIVLICGPRVGSNITVAEKSKIEDCLELFISHFFRCEHSFKQLKAASKQIQLLQEEEIALLTKNSIDYYRAKAKNGFKFQTWGDTSGSGAEDKANQIDPNTLHLPFFKEDSVQDNDSVAGGSKNGAAQSQQSQNSSSDSASVNRPPSAADLKQLINLHDGSSDKNQRQDQRLLEPAFKEGYSLIFGTLPVYLVFKMIASIYERLVKAKQLIATKVDQDLEKAEIQDVLGFTNDEASLAESIKNYKEQACVERFKLFVNALVGTLSQTPQKKLDPSNYEDIVRMLMGDQAYLLFVFDKLIMQTLKNLPILKTSDECQKNLQLFSKFSKPQPGKPQNEHLYLTQFQQQMQSVNNFHGTCIRLLYSPLSGVLCLHQFSLSPFVGLTQGSGSNSHHGTQTLASFKTIDAHKSKLLKQSMYYHHHRRNEKKTYNNNNQENSRDLSQDPQLQPPQQQSSQSTTSDVENLRVPVFLNRNRRKMKELRKHLWQKEPAETEAQGEIMVENGLVMRQVPLIKKLMYDAHSMDIMVYKRRRTTATTAADRASFEKQRESERTAHDYATTIKFQQVLQRQKERLFKQLASSEEVENQSITSQTNLQQQLQQAAVDHEDKEMEHGAVASGHLSDAAGPQQTEEQKEEQRSEKDSGVKASVEGAAGAVTSGTAIKTEEEAKKTTATNIAGASPGSKAAAIKAEATDVEMGADDMKKNKQQTTPEVKNETSCDPAAANSSTIKEDEQQQAEEKPSSAKMD